MAEECDGGGALAGLRGFVRAAVVSAASDWDRAGMLPEGILAELGRRGWLASFLEPAEGGVGLDMVAYGRLHEELGCGCSSLRCAVTAHDMVAVAVRRWGEVGQRQRWLSRLARGEVVGAFALSESGAGSDVSAMRTVARREGDRFVLDGKKRWVTNGLRAGVFLVFARTAEGAGAFLVPRDTPGLTLSPMEPLLGTRAVGISEVTFEGCRLAPEALVGGVRAGLRFVLPAALALGRYAIACGCLGMARACLDAAIEHAGRPSASGVSLSSHQLVCRMIARMVAGVRAAGLLCRACGASLEAGAPGSVPEAALAKYFASGVAREVTADAVQIFGGEGCLQGNIVERFFRDAKVMEIIEGANEVLELVIARHGIHEYLAMAGGEGRD
ncbi:MAG TPA: acyl-CoA dehydrogenase family protein [Verrucomicrobiae bacterium]|nr:acyl-CoA dehydrogenase family protein [Verrucomicrobiae bacterium]